ncbi:sugar kinase YeiI [Klebsiella michiganensis]|nr:sugar kinase YeiI [Klebsiella michiganensis]
MLRRRRGAGTSRITWRCWGRDVHLISAVGSDFYGETLLEQTRQAGVNVQSCIRLHGHNTSTYLSIANPQEETVLGD